MFVQRTSGEDAVRMRRGWSVGKGMDDVVWKNALLE